MTWTTVSAKSTGENASRETRASGHRHTGPFRPDTRTSYPTHRASRRHSSSSSEPVNAMVRAHVMPASAMSRPGGSFSPDSQTTRASVDKSSGRQQMRRAERQPAGPRLDPECPSRSCRPIRLELAIVAVDPGVLPPISDSYGQGQAAGTSVRALADAGERAEHLSHARHASVSRRYRIPSSIWSRRGRRFRSVMLWPGLSQPSHPGVR